jgi:two-component system nitrogen regulation response regulator NtrX
MPLILLVDDVQTMADQYAYDLKRLAGYETIVATSGEEALSLLASEPVDCVILDLEMPAMDGFEVLRRMEKEHLAAPVIVYTGTGSYARCIQAVRLGASGFIDKAEPMERVAQEVEQAIARRRLEDEVRSLSRQLGKDSPLIGSSQPMTQLKERITRLAPVPSPVLIVGESGTGKELVARELHRVGANPKGPFVALNSAALPADLVESELFGHERGAFTGAHALRKGAFEAASGGTLFLDEIGELPSAAQAKLLRVLEQREITRVGGSRTIKVDTRVVAATNRDLERETAEGRFREDLLFRLNAHVVHVPPLRGRRSDIPEIVRHLVLETCARFGMKPKRVPPDTLESLAAAEWRRNNVRELRNVIERMIIAADGNDLTIDLMPEEFRLEGIQPRTAHRAQTFHDLKAEAERQIVIQALDRNEWHITKTAKALGLADHASLLKIMKRHGIEK